MHRGVCPTKRLQLSPHFSEPLNRVHRGKANFVVLNKNLLHAGREMCALVNTTGCKFVNHICQSPFVCHICQSHIVKQFVG